MNDIELYECGTWVVSKVGSIEGMITAIVIRFNDVRYEMTYHDGCDFKTVLLREEEIEGELVRAEKKVGFQK